MILPTKHLPVERTLLAVGAKALECLATPRSVTSLWEEVGNPRGDLTFQRFALALTFLRILGLIEFEGDLLQRAHS